MNLLIYLSSLCAPGLYYSDSKVFLAFMNNRYSIFGEFLANARTRVFQDFVSVIQTSFLSLWTPTIIY